MPQASEGDIMAWNLFNCSGKDFSENALWDTILGCRSFVLAIEFNDRPDGTYDRMIFLEHEGNSFKQTGSSVLSSYAIAQEWATRLHQLVRLVLEADHKIFGPQHWIVKSFRHDQCDERPTEPLVLPLGVEFKWKAEDDVVSKPIILFADPSLSAYRPMWCVRAAGCNQIARMFQARQTRNGYVTYRPICSAELRHRRDDLAIR